MTKISALLQLIIGVIGISFAPIFVKPVNISPEWITFFRAFYGLISLLLINIVIQKRFIKKANHKELKGYLILLLIAAIFVFDLNLWHDAIFLIGAGISTVIANIQVVFSSIIDKFLNNKKLNAKWFFSITLALFGLVLILVKDFNISYDNSFIQGVIFSIVAGFAYAWFLFFFKKYKQKYTNENTLDTWLLISFFIVLLSFVVAYLKTGALPIFDFENQKYMIGLGFVCHGVSWFFISNSMKKIELHKISFYLVKP